MARLRSGIVNVRSSARGSTVMGSDDANSFSISAARRRVHRRPVEFLARHLEPVLGGRLDRHRLVDAVRGQMPGVDGFAKRVAKGRRLKLEEPQRVAHEAAVLGVRQHVGLGRAGRCSQAELDAVEMPEDSAPLPVDRAVALVGDHEIEVTRRQVAVLRDPSSARSQW